MSVVYEWDFETFDEDGDIINHDHADALATYHKPSDITSDVNLVLVRDTGNAWDGVTDRMWAYAEKTSSGTWMLPDTFDGLPNGYRVPVKFHRELAKWQGLTYC